MKRLVETFESLFAATAESGGELATTAQFTLDNVDWQDALARHEQTDQTDKTIVDAHLDVVCGRSGEVGSHSNDIANALLAVPDQLNWCMSPRDPTEGPDAVALSRNFVATTVIGGSGILHSDKVAAGFSLQAPDIYYPPHAHFAEESYWIIGGEGDWRVGSEPWFAVKPGDTIYHAPEARHTMQTNGYPMLTIWLWTSDLDSEVVIVRS
jgi:quercetin dioxygenase-like cupin family protein